MGFRQAAGDEEPAARVSLPEKAPCLYSGRISRRTGSRDSISQLSRQRHGATLLLDSMRGDAMLFTRRDEVEAEWRIITPIEEAWAQLPTPDFPNYAAGTEGPASWQELLEIRGNTAEHSGNESLQVNQRTQDRFQLVRCLFTVVHGQKIACLVPMLRVQKDSVRTPR
jgi:Glucose-6-phosphate dehydrogenase, C-terminal domain